jgi:crotonobetainyl-CoA:carnitine CoA-transferase CaiB-like acyl-CoA transferase
LLANPPFLDRLGHKARRRMCPLYVTGLIGPGDRKSVAAKFSRWAPRGDVKADRLGEHNEQILRDMLKLSDAEIRQLYLDKTIVRDPLLERENA